MNRKEVVFAAVLSAGIALSGLMLVAMVGLAGVALGGRTLSPVGLFALGYAGGVAVYCWAILRFVG